MDIVRSITAAVSFIGIVERKRKYKKARERKRKENNKKIMTHI